MSGSVIPKLKKAGLTGRGGGGFPTGKKWELVKEARGKEKYIICNGSEGELNVFKDKYILEHYPKMLIEGIVVALKEFKNSKAYIFLNEKYYDKFKNKLGKLTKNLDIKLVKEKGGYLSGEETTLLNELEEREIIEPRPKPPYPTESGLSRCPTLINNIETFYHIAQIARNEYKKMRFYSISGDINRKGVYEFPESYTVEKTLKESGNYPSKPFFVQVGGGAIGEILLQRELKRKITGAGAIVVYDKKNTDTIKLMKKWAKFFIKENCDKCTPCREGIYRINEMLKSGKIDRKKLDELFFVMEKTSFCPLGSGAYLPFKSLCEKLRLK